MPRASRSILTCICSAIVFASTSTALAGAGNFFTDQLGGDPAAFKGPSAEGNCLSCDSGGVCDSQVGITGGFLQACNDGQWVSLGFPFDTGGSVVSSVTSVHNSNVSAGDLYIMGGTCGGPDVNNILAVVCDAIVGAPAGVPITTDFPGVATSAVNPTWVVMVFRDSFAFDVAFNSATLGTPGAAFGNLSGAGGPAEWIDLNNFGFGACYCVTLGGGPAEPGACCLEDFTCVDGLLPDECDALGGVFQGNNSNCADVDCGPATGACCLEEGDVCQDGTTQADCDAAGGTYQGDNSDCANINCSFNDDCATAEAVDVPSSTNGDSTGAQADNVPSCGTSISPGVWYSLIGTGTTITASTCNMAAYDTKITIFCGPCDDLTCVIGVDDAAGCAGFTTEVEWCAGAGVTYYILVHGFGNQTGAFTLGISENGVNCTADDGCVAGCDDDADCPDGFECVDGACQPIPPTPEGGCCQCDEDGGQFCTTETEDECAALGGAYLGDDAPCETGGEIIESSSPNISIPDNNLGGVSDSINVAVSATILDLEVQIEITHTWIGDLCVSLSKDGGANQLLMSRIGADTGGNGCHSGSPFGCSDNDLNVVLDDDAAASIEGQCASPLLGTYRPDPGSLAGFVGGDSAGTWTLTVVDNAAGDNGTFVSWSLILTLPSEGDTPCEEAFPDQCVSNEPPDCSGAFASEGELWPPNHRYHDISILGVTDPDGDTVTITITSIFQDESINGQGDGNTCPDATGVGSSTASVRAERAGPLDGRVYHIFFTADDGNGGTCDGSVTVCVPHDQGQGSECVDQGPTDDSTDCGGGAAGAQGLGMTAITGNGPTSH